MTCTEYSELVDSGLWNDKNLISASIHTKIIINPDMSVMLVRISVVGSTLSNATVACTDLVSDKKAYLGP